MSVTPSISVLAADPRRVHRINADSYQQHALITFNGYQYAAFYTETPDSEVGRIDCFVTLARRTVTGTNGGEWQYLVFEDYRQTMDDGHNTISMGICKGDGTIHLSYDHHCDQLRYRISIQGLASEPEKHAWTASLFGRTENTLPGLQRTSLMDEVTYPRFVNVDEDLLLSYRIGQAGSGSDLLYRYFSESGLYEYVGMPLKGVGNSPYINGIDCADGRLHISWCYRGFVEYEGVHDKNSTAHKAQAGPNGPENNYGLFYAYSEDLGRTWKGSNGSVVAMLEGGREKLDHDVQETILPHTRDILVFDIPKYSGILNQEAQAVDGRGGFHILNREKVEGVEKWIVYSRDPTASWSRTPIPNLDPTETGPRGSICADNNGNIFCILPGNNDSSLTILRASAESRGTFETFWTSEGYDGEPLVDPYRAVNDGVLSIFTRTAPKSDGRRDVVVVDLDIAKL